MDIPFFLPSPVDRCGNYRGTIRGYGPSCGVCVRMQEGEPLILVDGRGTKAHASILHTAKKKCSVRITSMEVLPDDRPQVTVAVSPVKNAARYEWMLEKLTEIGIRRVIPLLTERTVRERMRADRLESIAVSAMLQSQQAWMTEVSAPCSLTKLLEEEGFSRRYVAHCLPESRIELRNENRTTSPVLIMIGPEGDFNPAEIEASISAGCIPVSLGANRLRTETAALVAAVILSV